MNYSPIVESSGVVVSRRHKDVLWTHNDGSNRPSLFAVNPRGRLIREYQIPGAINQDWEDIALDEEGFLYILDNTSRTDPDKRSDVYIVAEPDPLIDLGVSNPRRIRLAFPPEQGPYDIEAMLVHDKRLFLITKPWDGSLPRIYRASDLSRDGVLEYVGDVPVHTMVTAADISEDGRRIVLASYRALLIFEGEGGVEALLQSTPLICQLNARQVEAVAWEGERIYLTNEQREIYRIKASKWRNHTAPFLRRPEKDVPFALRRPSVHVSLEQWGKGEWLTVRLEGREAKLGRLLWTQEGLHIGLELPQDVNLRAVDLTLAQDFNEWFLPGIVYLLINPDGERPLSYGADDRCIVFSRNAEGVATAKSLYLRPATLIAASEDAPRWVSVQESGNRLLITLKPDAPGFGNLQEDRAIGFNLLMIRGDGQLVSWAPLTRPYSWDQPNVWGLLELVD
ncbi:MAG TPA: hypothetical protein VLU25_13630 [Acidobacteriota bacterium]|nr:hypothetical protein [Acidobacteriota bacterium]